MNITQLILVFLTCFMLGHPIFSQDLDISSKDEQAKYVLQKRQNAIANLRTIITSSRSLSNIRQRAEVVNEAAIAIWNEEKEFASSTFNEFLTTLLSDYNSLATKPKRTDLENNRLQDLDQVLKRTVRALANKDLVAAQKFQEQFLEIRQLAFEGRNLDDKLGLASEGLDHDEQMAVAMMSAVLQTGVPTNFARIILELRATKPEIANNLMGIANQQLGSNPNYRISDAITLSSIIFSEPIILNPYIPDESNPNNAGVLTTPIGMPNSINSSALISGYYNAAQSFFNTRLVNSSLGFFNSPQNLLGSYFLLEKLRLYAQTYGLANPVPITNLLVQITPMANSAGLNQQTLAHVSANAQGLVAANNPLQLSDGSDLLEKADNAKTPEEKMQYLIQAVIRLIESRRYEKAESTIFDIQDSAVRDVLYLFLHFRAAMDGTVVKNWKEFDKRVSKINDKKILAFLYLSALSAADAEEDSQVIGEFTIKAEKFVFEIPVKNEKAIALVVLADLFAKANMPEAIRLMPLVLKDLNEFTDYNENRFEARLPIPGMPSHFANYIGSGAFRRLFTSLAKTNADDAYVQARSVKQPWLQNVAEIIVAKTVLEKLPAENIKDINETTEKPVASN